MMAGGQVTKPIVVAKIPYKLSQENSYGNVEYSLHTEQIQCKY